MCWNFAISWRIDHYTILPTITRVLWLNFFDRHVLVVCFMRFFLISFLELVFHSSVYQLIIYVKVEKNLLLCMHWLHFKYKVWARTFVTPSNCEHLYSTYNECLRLQSRLSSTPYLISLRCNCRRLWRALTDGQFLCANKFVSISLSISILFYIYKLIFRLPKVRQTWLLRLDMC